MNSQSIADRVFVGPGAWILALSYVTCYFESISIDMRSSYFNHCEFRDCSIERGRFVGCTFFDCTFEDGAVLQDCGIVSGGVRIVVNGSGGVLSASDLCFI